MHTHTSTHTHTVFHIAIKVEHFLYTVFMENSLGYNIFGTVSEARLYLLCDALPSAKLGIASLLILWC